MTDLRVTNVRPWGREPVDILIGDGVIEAMPPAHGADAPAAGPAAHGAADSAAPGGARLIDGRGLLALPGFINAHAHVDKSWWGQPWVSYGGEGGTQGRIAHERAERDRLGIPSVEGAVAVLREFLRQGTTATRTHVDVDLGVGLRGIENVREAAARLDGAIEVEIVAFPQDGVLRRPGVLDLLDQAAAAGATHLGGLDPAGIDRDPVGQLDALFEIAERRDVGLDIHLHDPGELGAFQYDLIIERTARAGLGGRVTISHGFALGEVAAARGEGLVEAMAAAGVGLATVAPVRSAPLPWSHLREYAVPVGLGTDGIRDLWSPFGDGDMLRIALGFARLHGLRNDEELTTAVRLATSAAAGFVSRPVHDLEPGARADLVLLDAENVPDALVRVPRRELVLSVGRVVARDGEVSAGGG
ncbi:amidohydrolase [Ornithinimicrobium sp. F0845]|uniref:amidohydrolase n=1 Tax=Ornithinimicrobium sp. F0845 TaxID=2926412 RepID=UPI001FF4FCF4|nr:amidohydrolase [Ornithinimicrobium sp. F0845]MCK0112174.1 amidohydrolase [Ornithinimicrobium sp. F0845]